MLGNLSVVRTWEFYSFRIVLIHWKLYYIMRILKKYSIKIWNKFMLIVLSLWKYIYFWLFENGGWDNQWKDLSRVLYLYYTHQNNNKVLYLLYNKQGPPLTLNNSYFIDKFKFKHYLNEFKFPFLNTKKYNRNVKSKFFLLKSIINKIPDLYLIKKNHTFEFKYQVSLIIGTLKYQSKLITRPLMKCKHFMSI